MSETGLKTRSRRVGKRMPGKTPEGPTKRTRERAALRASAKEALSSSLEAPRSDRETAHAAAEARRKPNGASASPAVSAAEPEKPTPEAIPATSAPQPQA